MSITGQLQKIIQRQDLTEQEAETVMDAIMEGVVSQVQMAALLVALQMKGETVEEITGFAKSMRRRALRVDIEGPLLDTCGTGGDGLGTFNISTAAAFVVAGCGVRVAKHGNRASSSKCGSADVLEALGANIEQDPELFARCLNRSCVGFLYAPLYQPSMKHAGPVRKELGIKTVFNILGPLTNPAGAEYQSLGVAQGSYLERVAQALCRLGTRHALVYSAENGMDEVSTTCSTHIVEVRDGSIVREFDLFPEDVGIARVTLADIRGYDAQTNAKILQGVLEGEKGPYRDIVLLNAAIGLVAADVSDSIENALELAVESVDSGRAFQQLKNFIDASRV